MASTSENSQQHGLTAAEIGTLSTACMEARDRAYCKSGGVPLRNSIAPIWSLSVIGPYSHFRVGASILMSDGTLVLGANVENASYPVTICAERTALTTAIVSHGMKRGQMKAVGVATDLEQIASPCGMCRQALREFADVSPCASS